MKKCAYFFTYDNGFKPLKPTGKWKLVTNAYESNALYIQHKGWIFKTWIHEADICFRDCENEIIFDCGNMK